nr:sugar phosphate nucleotidyltransferase [Curtanaerobium respiraculi]
MKTVILAGGFGTRISEESHLKPKPMVEICGMPILWHIMKVFTRRASTSSSSARAIGRKSSRIGSRTTVCTIRT